MTARRPVFGDGSSHQRSRDAWSIEVIVDRVGPAGADRAECALAMKIGQARGPVLEDELPVESGGGARSAARALESDLDRPAVTADRADARHQAAAVRLAIRVGHRPLSQRERATQRAAKDARGSRLGD